MDGYYQDQVSMPYFKGSARQRGRGLGTFALTVGLYFQFLKSLLCQRPNELDEVQLKMPHQSC
jgi:hypothetical protein